MGRITQPQLSFADLEWQRQGIVLSPLLQGISDLLDQHSSLVEMVYRDLVRGLKKPTTGREGMEAERVLRSFVLQRIKNWDLRELRERVADSYTLRQFTTFHSNSVPSHQSFHRAFTRLTPATLGALNEAVVQAAVQLEVEDGKKLRVDSTVVETNIHHPTDSTLLWDSVRVLTRLVRQMGGQLQLPELTGRFPNRCRRARRRMLEISRMDRRQRQRQQKRKYRELLRITQEVVHRARQVAEEAPAQVPAVAGGAASAAPWVEQIGHYCRLAEQVIQQTRRRVLQGETVPAQEKILSIFEPHTDLIKRGKVDRPVEFGHKIFLAESAIGLITEYRVLDGNPPDEQQLPPSLRHHQKMFGVPPELYAGDRGFYSSDNLQQAAEVRTVCLPYRGGKKTPEREAFEKSPAFKKGQRFRAGIEGRISVLFRGRGMKRCLLEGRERFEVFVGAAVLANNLMAIAHHLKLKQARRRRSAA